MTKTHRGSCHCGKVKYEADIDLSQGTVKCNCTLCWKRRTWGVYIPPGAFRLLEGQGELQHGADGGFCRSCGVISFWRADTSTWGIGADVLVCVNLPTLDDLQPADLAAAPLKFLDGRNNDWWTTPAETRHL